MITAETIQKLIEEQIARTDIFLVDVIVKAGNSIQIQLDRPGGISIEECMGISRFLNGEMDREIEDYALEVSSPGLDAPFKVRQQYEKNLGRDVEVLMGDQKRLKGTLLSISESGMVIQVKQNSASTGSQKKKKSMLVEKEVNFSDIKTTKAIISFK